MLQRGRFGRSDLRAGEALAAGDRPAFGGILDGTVRIAPADGAAQTCGESDVFRPISQAHATVCGGSDGARLVVERSVRR